MAVPLRRREALKGSARAAALATAPYELGGGATHVRDHGARGDGVADDSGAIPAAIDATGRAGGGTVLLPPGAYALARGLHVTWDAVTLLGAGQGATTLLVWPAVNGDILAFDGRAAPSGIAGGGVRQLTMSSDEPRASGIALHFTDTSRVVVQDVDVRHMFVGCKIDGHGSIHHIARGYWTRFSPGGVGLWVDVVANPPLGGNDQFVSHLVIDNTEELARQPYAGIRLTNTQAVWLDECDVLSCRHGLAIDPAGAPNAGIVSCRGYSRRPAPSCRVVAIRVGLRLRLMCRDRHLRQSGAGGGVQRVQLHELLVFLHATRTRVLHRRLRGWR